MLGANDGLVSNLSLVMGVAGAALSSRSTLITGMAGLLAGACSMAMGEWVSVRSSSEAAARQLEIEADELDTFPDEEAEELGIDPDGLEGSPAVAAVSSFVLFAIGAIVPVLPFVFSSGTVAVVLAVAGSGLGLFALGAAITMFTGRGVVRSGLRPLAIGWGAAVVTYGIGAAIGVSTS